MRIFGGLVLIAALSLTGCATTPPPAAEAKSQQPEKEAAQLVPDEATAEPEASADDGLYLEEVRLRLMGMTSATDTQLLEAAAKACGMYADGGTKETIETIDGAHPDEPMPGWNNMVIATWAAKIYCPEFES